VLANPVKNVESYILLPPDARKGVDLLIDARAQVGIPASNAFVFGRLTADTPMAGHTDLQELAQSCEGLKFPERITSRRLRTYIATVSQVNNCLPLLLLHIVSIGTL